MPQQEGTETCREPDETLAVEHQQDVARRMEGHADGEQDGLPSFVLREQGEQRRGQQGQDQEGLDAGMDALEPETERDDVDQGQGYENEAGDPGGFFHWLVFSAS